VTLAGTAASAAADVVTLKNGDALTGTFVSVSGTTLRFHSDALGTISIPLRQIAATTPLSAATVFVRGRAPRAGELTLLPTGDWQLVVAGFTYVIHADDVSVILPAAAYAAIVDHQAPPWRDWSGTANLGYSIQRGNQETNTFSTTVDAKRERPASPVFQPHWRTSVHVTALLSNALEAGASIGSNTATASVRQDAFFTAGNFVFGVAQYDHVGAQGLRLRQTYGGGSGYDFSETPRTSFSIFAGLTFVRETLVAAPDEQTAQALVGEKLRVQLTDRVRLDHSVEVYPNLSFPGEYHFDTTSSIAVKLTNRFSLDTSVIDLYFSRPAPGTRQNNFALTTGVTVTF